MAKAKARSVKKSATKAKSKVKSRARRSYKTATIYGLEHEFIIITGGGFVVIALAFMLFFQ
jgi:hypothetical protein